MYTTERFPLSYIEQFKERAAEAMEQGYNTPEEIAAKLSMPEDAVREHLREWCDHPAKSPFEGAIVALVSRAIPALR